MADRRYLLACLFVPALALAAELAARPQLRGQPVAVTDEAGRRVAEASPAATGRGVRPGQRLAEAVGWCPALVVLEPRPARVRRAAARLVEAAATVSPLVEEATPGEVYADLRGLDGLYPRADAIPQALLDAAPPALGARLGLAGSRFTARAAASAAEPGAWLRVGDDEARAWLAPLPIGLLPLETAALNPRGIPASINPRGIPASINPRGIPASINPRGIPASMKEWLGLLGIATLGDLAALPRHAVEAQLGADGGRAWLAARGEDPTPLTPMTHDERVEEHAQAEPPLTAREAVLHTFGQLLGRALTRPRARGRLVRAVRLTAVTEDEHVWERTRVLTEPTGDRDRLWTALRPSIEAAEFGGPVSALALELGGLTAERGRQGRLLRERGGRRREQLDEMARHLQLRYGRAALRRVVTIAPHSRIPERRYALADYEP